MFLPKKSVFAFVFSLILGISCNATNQYVKPATPFIRQKSIFSTFWDFKRACDRSYATQKSCLSQKEFLAELEAFCQIQNRGSLAEKDNWILTALVRGKQMPSSEFYTTTTFEPYVQKLEVPTTAEVAFHGDVHGDIKSFNAFIQDLQIKGYMDPEDPFKIIKPNFYIIMLGDYTDRGHYGAEVLYAVMRMKRANPNTFFMVRGNHEDLSINAQYGLIDELRSKFDDPVAVISAIDRIYNYLPVALYVKSVNNAIQCCHGGMEVGFYNIKNLLATSQTQQFVLLDTLKRKTCVHELSAPAQQAFASVHVSDFNEYKPASIGFMWNDFTFESENNTSRYNEVQSVRDRGYEYPQRITQHLLKHVSTPLCNVRGVFRAHQHNHNTMHYVLNRNEHTHAENTGVAKLWPPHDHMQQPAQKLWDGIVCTFSVSPGAYGSSFNYKFDSYGILNTATNFDDWRLQMNRLVTTQ